MPESNGANVGRVEQVTGVVVDVVFPDHIPEIFHALTIDVPPEGGRTEGKLTLEMNRVRQAEITQEILEVVAGAEALG